MINPVRLMELKRIKNTFEKNHPKFCPFLNAVSKDGIKEGTIIELQVTTPEGTCYKTNLKLTASDIEALEKAKAQIPG